MFTRNGKEGSNLTKYRKIGKRKSIKIFWIQIPQENSNGEINQNFLDSNSSTKKKQM
jgi:hypothetical protein